MNRNVVCVILYIVDQSKLSVIKTFDNCVISKADMYMGYKILENKSVCSECLKYGPSCDIIAFDRK